MAQNAHRRTTPNPSVRLLRKSHLVRPEEKSSNSQFDAPGPEELMKLFNSLKDWERQLAQLDPKSLRCDDEHFTL